MKKTRIVITNALTEKDIIRGELGRYPPMTLNNALKIAQRMLKGAYIQVTLTKNPCN